jgi:hypothetical protein
MEEVFQAPQVPAGGGSETMLATQEGQRMLALQALGWGAKRISREVGCSRNTVREYLRRGGWRPVDVAVFGSRAQDNRRRDSRPPGPLSSAAASARSTKDPGAPAMRTASAAGVGTSPGGSAMGDKVFANSQPDTRSSGMTPLDRASRPAHRSSA